VLLVPSYNAVLCGIVLVGSGLGVTLSLYRSLINEIAPRTLRGQLVSVSESIGRLVITITPILMGITIGMITPYFGFELAVETVGVVVAVLTSVIGSLGLVTTLAARTTLDVE